MYIYIIRHGIAEDHAHSLRDEDRALTEEGKEKMKEAARGLKRMDPDITRIFSSPLVRAIQTAEIVAAELKMKVDLLKQLAPGHTPVEVCDSLKLHKSKASAVAVVGHEPDCSELASHLLDAPGGVNIDFKKGAVCLIESESLEMGSGCLLWHLSPKALRLMSG
jgi:phosphohistidine phosphatase